MRLLFFFFIKEIVIEKICLVEDGWNSCFLVCVFVVYIGDC